MAAALEKDREGESTLRRFSYLPARADAVLFVAHT